DLNFHNIMVDTTGTVKLVDFGVHDSTSTYMTPQFAMAEVLAGRKPDFDSDMYSLSRVLSEASKKSKSPVPVLDVNSVSRPERRGELAAMVKERLQVKNSQAAQTLKLESATNERSKTIFIRNKIV